MRPTQPQTVPQPPSVIDSIRERNGGTLPPLPPDPEPDRFGKRAEPPKPDMRRLYNELQDSMSHPVEDIANILLAMPYPHIRRLACEFEAKSKDKSPTTFQDYTELLYAVAVKITEERRAMTHESE